MESSSIALQQGVKRRIAFANSEARGNSPGQEHGLRVPFATAQPDVVKQAGQGRLTSAVAIQVEPRERQWNAAPTAKTH
jgi:hypothetical protein